MEQDPSGQPLAFHPGVPPPWRSRRRRFRPNHADADAEEQKVPEQPWEERITTPPEPGRIRLLNPPTFGQHFSHLRLWAHDYTLTEWHHMSINDPETAAIFHTNQRARHLARLALNRWRQRIWRRTPACGVDLIMNDPVPDADAVFLTDTTNRTVYKFHRRDVFNSLLSNICMSDEMLPCPRPPTNPWTNQPLTLGQTIGLCQQLVADYGRRGKCPPPMFAAFWAARFDLRRFQDENSSALAQHAIRAFFKDLHDDNRDVVYDTLAQLLQDAGCDFSPTALRRWLRQTPVTPLHTEWLQMCRDYTLYINLHVQVRRRWVSEEYIHADVRVLYARTTLPDATSLRMRTLREIAHGGPPLTVPALSLFGLPALTIPTAVGTVDASGNMTPDLAIQLIQAALFRL